MPSITLAKRYGCAVLALLLLLGLCACQAASSTGPTFEKILPGDARFNAERMHAHEVSYRKSGGKMIYRITPTDRQDDPVWEVAVYFGDLSATPDRIYLDRQTLALRGRRLEMKDYVIDVNFVDQHFSGSLAPTAGSDYSERRYNKAYEHGVFEPAVLNYVIAALPLEVGFQASLPTLDLNGESSLYWANIDVVKREVIKIDGVKHDTWKVRSHGIKQKTLWISTSEPFVVQMKTSGNFGTWKMTVP